MDFSNRTEDLEAILKKKRVQLIIKRVFDITASMFGIVLLLPVFLVIAVLIKIDSRGPIIFKQERVGKKGRRFHIYKFRTMVDKAETLGKQLTIGEDKRITNLGRVIRRYRLDEFAQLFNVIKGDMSLVGPRPEVPKYAELYKGDARQVFLVQPGITDYASIEYRDENSMLGQSDNPEEMYIHHILPRKIRLKLKYIREISIYTDIKIILLTFKAIMKC